MIIKIMDTEFEFDIFDVDNSAAYEKALEDLSKEEESLTKALTSKKMSEMNKAMINMFRTFFKTATGADVLANCTNSNAATSAYNEFITIVGNSQAYIVQQYSPARVK